MGSINGFKRFRKQNKLFTFWSDGESAGQISKTNEAEYRFHDFAISIIEDAKHERERERERERGTAELQT